jgi:hypothetical protein
MYTLEANSVYRYTSPPKMSRSRALRPCKQCGQHRAGYLFRGRYKWNKEHDLCGRCYGSHMDHCWSIDRANRRKRRNRYA